MSKQSQAQRVLDYLKTYHTITQADAMREFGCARLASRICDLRALGHEIQREMVTDKNRFGETVRYARYYLL